MHAQACARDAGGGRLDGRPHGLGRCGDVRATAQVAGSDFKRDLSDAIQELRKEGAGPPLREI